ncbi:hypothetical protein ACKKBG_A38105 [Auxenochlorella protothecoides x Auxenochlorella symbiontica]
MPTATSLAALPEAVLRSPEVRCALGMLCALSRRDWTALLSRGAGAPRRLRCVLAQRLAAGRAEALAVLCASYRSLEAEAAGRWLQCPAAELPALLKALADGGSQTAQHALDEMQWEDKGTYVLYFKS